MENDMIMYDENDAIAYIALRCNLDEETIAKILDLEMEYMESIGIAEAQ